MDVEKTGIVTEELSETNEESINKPDDSSMSSVEKTCLPTDQESSKDVDPSCSQNPINIVDESIIDEVQTNIEKNETENLSVDVTERLSVEETNAATEKETNIVDELTIFDVLPEASSILTSEIELVDKLINEPIVDSVSDEILLDKYLEEKKDESVEDTLSEKSQVPSTSEINFVEKDEDKVDETINPQNLEASTTGDENIEKEKLPDETVSQILETNTSNNDKLVDQIQKEVLEETVSQISEIPVVNNDKLEKEKEKATDETKDQNSEDSTTKDDKDIEKEKDAEKAETQNSENPTIINEKTVEKEKEIPETQNDSNIHEKESTIEKNTVTENTEFVQITQDKQDDSQNEVQSIDAEDPFGGDSLPADNVESMDTDDIQEMNFCKLGEQADNLQDVVNAKTSGDSSKKVNKTTAEVSSADNASTSKKVSEKTSENKDEDVEANKSKTLKMTEKTQKKDTEKDKKKDNDDNDALQIESTSDEHSSVLPGQDDELCIIPDSVKVVASEQTKSAADKTKEDKDKNKDGEKSKENSNLKSTTESTDVNKKSGVSVISAAKTSIASTISKSKDKPLATSKDTETDDITEITDNVIEIDIEAKSSPEVEVMPSEKCKQCKQEKVCKIQVRQATDVFNVCSKTCQNKFHDIHGKATDIPSDGANSKYEKRCANCLLIVETDDERNLSWETMEFCNEECLGKFQTKYGSYCRNCNGGVQPISLGKYCVRFGYDVRQFCCSTCLEEFKKGLKVCSYCQKDISSGTDGFLAPVGDKGQFKDFCTQHCMEKYSKMNSSEPPSIEKKACGVCQEKKVVHCEVQIDRGVPQAMCSEPCFNAFKFVNKVDPDQCSTCKKYFEVVNKKNTVVFYNNEAHTFCNKSCLNVFIITNRKIVPCNWCKVKKYNFDMIKKDLKTGGVVMMCSLNCLTLYQVSINAVSARKIYCDLCKEFSQAQYHLTMSDATIRNFCSYNCVMKFQGQYAKSPITIPTGDDTQTPVPTGMPKRTYPGKFTGQSTTKKGNELQNIAISGNLQNMQVKKSIPVITSVSSLASMPSNGQSPMTISQKSTTATNSSNMTTSSSVTSVGTQSQVIYKQQVITRPTSPVKIHNKMTQCKPLMHTKGVSVRPRPCVKSTQTDEVQKIFVPIPVPIYVPFPVHMWSFPFPIPMPFPIPIPVPIFIPTTRNSAKGIFKEIKKIQEKMPADPYEAELLMMAEMVATEKKANESDSDSSSEETAAEPVESENTVFEADEDNETPDTLDPCNLDLNLEIPTEDIQDPAVDLEAALTSNTITATTSEDSVVETPVPVVTDAIETLDTVDTPEIADVDLKAQQSEQSIAAPTTKGRKRAVSAKAKSSPNKRNRKSAAAKDKISTGILPPPSADAFNPLAQPRNIDSIEKPDANMALKYTFGVNAWRQWVATKNIELEKQCSVARKAKLFKTELLQLTADELNYSLCLFIKEVRKPNGAEYAPDTIYYLCLGIQQYLFENNRIDNIFTDTYYEKFTDCLDNVAKKFSVLYNDAQYIVTRVEEEHLWECKQLGAHSPHVLLNTLMFFNTKHFNLVSMEEHMQLSFSHIMKHWKRNPATQNAGTAGKVPGSRNVLLRFYPPQSALEANSKKKKVYEQQENEDNPLRCPVKLYEFYLSKCPESVKTRNDVFYLLPERSCVPDSPVWYSTSALAKENLVKMLNRVKIVKEINVALLSS